MGSDDRRTAPGRGVYFLDENHCRNPYMIDAIEKSGFACEKHLDHFAAGTPDTAWLPVIARRGWSLITTDARIRTNLLEREAVRIHHVRMQHLVETQRPPFTASISKGGEVRLRDTFEVDGDQP